MSVTVSELYRDLWATPRPGFDEAVGTSLNPRSGTFTLEVLAGLGPDSASVVLDLGCRDANWEVEIVRKCGCRVAAVDPVESHLALAEEAVAEAGLQERIELRLGSAEALPLEEASVDFIWCRDVLNHVDLMRGLAECRRVMRPRGAMVVFQTLATELLEPREAERLYAALAIIPENMRRERFEARTQEAGFVIAGVHALGSETRELGLENGRYSFDACLLRLARMRRSEAELVERYGREFYEAEYAGDLWGVYQMLGMLFNYVHVLRKSR